MTPRTRLAGAVRLYSAQSMNKQVQAFATPDLRSASYPATIKLTLALNHWRSLQSRGADASYATSRRSANTQRLQSTSSCAGDGRPGVSFRIIPNSSRGRREYGATIYCNRVCVPRPSAVGSSLHLMTDHQLRNQVFGIETALTTLGLCNLIGHNGGAPHPCSQLDEPGMSQRESPHLIVSMVGRWSSSCGGLG